MEGQCRGSDEERNRSIASLCKEDQAQAKGLRTECGLLAAAPRCQSGASPSLGAILERMHVRVGKAEMMANLVNDDMADDLFETERG